MRPHNVSVCLAAYNGSAFITAQIESIVAQLEDGDELIIVNDKSSDATLEIIVAFAGSNAQIRIVNNARNMGVKKTFELSVLNSVNDIIVFCDQDDIWFTDKLSKIKTAFMDAKVSGYLSNAVVFGPDITDERLFFPHGYVPQLTIFDQLLRNDFIGCCFAFRRSMISHALPFPDFISMHDWWVGVSCLMSGNVLYDPEPLIKYRRHNANVSSMSRRSWRQVAWGRARDSYALLLLLFRFYCTRRYTSSSQADYPRS